MTDEELIARLRKADEYEPLGHDGWEAADRIEALVKQVDTMLTPEEAEKLVEMADPILSELLAVEVAYRKESEAKVERLTGALGHIESMTVHSGGEIHGVTAQHWQSAFEEAQEVARAALSATKEEGHE